MTSTPPTPTPLVTLEDVRLTYPSGQTALEGLTLTLNQGDFIAVVGASGSGKSTLLRLITQLLKPSSGRASFAHDALTVGMAFQNPTLLPWRTVLENVMLPLEVSPEHKFRLRSERAHYLEIAHELLRSVGLEGSEKRFPWELSGGMQQRASLCRALVHSPEVLLLDEPFGALDTFTREEMWMALDRLYLERRPTVVLFTHDLREAVLLADTVYVVGGKPGRVAHRQIIHYPRPRTLELSFLPEFSATVLELREKIRPGEVTKKGEVSGKREVNA